MTTDPHLARRSKEELSYNYFPRLGFHSLFQGELYLLRRGLTLKLLIYGSQNLQLIISLGIIHSLVFLMDVNSTV